MLNDIMRKVLQMLSISVSIVASLVSYYIGIEKERSLQAFFLGIALWLVSISIFTIAKTYNEENSKRCSLQKKCTFLINLVSLALILPFGVVLPFLGNIRCVDGIWLNRIDIQSWIIYSSIFAALLIITYLLSDIYKKRKF
ncbi:MAG: hypothetical protein J6J11_09815 [Treponema sp.]|nr:hypothetical protein [Clostridia bacterium]MBO5142295.1 hypothetical protein [Clostridia bacterium]MBP3608596.1 hypothetical protein [Treponema sp.]